MYQTENHDEYAFTITLDGHPVATVTRLGRRVDGDDAAGWATERGLPMENHLTDEQWRRLVALVKNAPTLLDAIDQCAASLENCLIPGTMGVEDLRQRTENAAAAREAQAQAEGFGRWDDALAAWCDGE
jgi:hypothetical protein